MNALERNRKLDWLKENPGEGSCRILTNARCLAEGVDVPALDAVMFLSPRKSVVDIVQSVGRVMRLDSKGEKQFGYIILPVGIPAGTPPEQALKDNKRYAVVWEVLQALRAHDERFDALVNRISLSKARDDKVNVIGVGGKDGDWEQTRLDLDLPGLDEWRDAIYASIVKKVGSREYWDDWAHEVAGIAQRQITRITALLEGSSTTTVRKEFDAFLDGLRGNLNESISEQDAVEMLAQHLITRPIFNALFAGDEFLDNNPVAQTMERMLAVLDQHDLEAENEGLHNFYESVRRKVADVKDREGRQELVRRLYDRFFALAFKKTADKLGIVYTPIPIVDFILRSADEVLQQEFDQRLTDVGVHILDGFTGTGTFLVRLLELGLITPHDLARKYAHELHGNEILLLAYYIAAVNIETTYLGVRREQDPDADYEAFPGLILTDTFQSWEDDDRPDLQVFPENNERLEQLKQLPITVIVGNPPYSSGQDSANDDNQNERYPALDAAIRSTYAELSTAKLKNSLYDSYIRAIKWATLRIEERGVIAFVTNGGFLDSNTADGLRKALADECTAIYVFNLRGNARGAGQQRKKEGGTVFGGGSRATVAITVLVKNPDRTGSATIRYTDVGDSLTTEQKLAKVAEAGSVFGLDATEIVPNEHGDWLNQRRDDFEQFVALSSDSEAPLFAVDSRGILTSRDAWAYSFSRHALIANMDSAMEFFNAQSRKYKGRTAQEISKLIDRDPARFAWDRADLPRVARGESYTLDPEAIRVATYRPFTREHLYMSRKLNNTVYQQFRIYPTAGTSNPGISVIAPGTPTPFAVLLVDHVPDSKLLGAGNAVEMFPRYRYELADGDGQLALDASAGEVIDGYRRIDNITDEGLARFEAAYGGEITKDDIFFYVYGLLHSPDYRETYAADLKKTLRRIPLVEDPWPFVEAGRDLAEIHLGYESETPYPLDGLDVEPKGDLYEFFAVEKMRFAKKGDKSTVIYNGSITLSGIPDDAHRYMLGSRSAIEWIVDRYRVKTDKASGIVNDPNAWSREVGDPRYIIDLLARIVTVSLRTTQIVDNLPALALRKGQGIPVTAAAT